MIERVTDPGAGWMRCSGAPWVARRGKRPTPRPRPARLIVTAASETRWTTFGVNPPTVRHVLSMASASVLPRGPEIQGASASDPSVTASPVARGRATRCSGSVAITFAVVDAGRASARGS